MIRIWALALLSAGAMASDAADVIQAGPMVGHVELMEARIWVQTKFAADVQIQYWADGIEPRLSESAAADAASHFTAQFALSGLEPGTHYEYRVMVNKRKVSFPYPLGFTTQVFWQWGREEGPPDFRFAMGSCLYVNDPPSDRPGEPYGGQFKIFDAIVAQKPDFMLWLGDNTYLRDPEFQSVKRMAYRYTHTRSFEPMQPLLAATAHYAIWDDHDYGPNDANRSFALKRQSLQLFKDFWANPAYGMPETPGVFFRFNWADVDFFMLDDRYYRAANRLRDADKPFLGEGQIQWLKDNLLTSYAAFKFIVVGNQFTNVYSRYEAFARFSGEYEAFMSWLDRAGVYGVVILSGDRHFTELLKTTRPGNYPLYEFTSSPLTSGTVSDLGEEVDNPLRVSGTLVNDARNFGLIQVSGPRGERSLTLQTYDWQGGLRWERKIKEAELKPE